MTKAWAHGEAKITLSNVKLEHARHHMPISRRDFVWSSAVTGSLLVLPGAFAANPGAPLNSRLQLALIGVSGRAKAALDSLRSEQFVAFCDVDIERARHDVEADVRTKGILGRFPDAKWFHDYREMFDQMADQIDAVLIVVPDHMHFPIGMEAIRRRKHVFIEKPLCRCVTEVRALHQAAKAAGVITQMGNQGRAADGIRLAREWVQAGLLGTVRAVHAYTNWPSEIYSHEPYLNDAAEAETPPPSLRYDLWLGVAPERAYLKRRSHRYWRGHTDYGCGALGDWACHQFDAAFYALDLDSPESVEAQSTQAKAFTFPQVNTLTYRFPARGKRAAVELKWFDGGMFPSEPTTGFRFGTSGGSVFYGDNGILRVASHSASARLVPEPWMQAMAPTLPPKTIPRIPAGNPHKEWVNAIRTGGRCGSDFDYAAPLAETALLGVAAVRARARLRWDAQAMKFTNNDDANQFIGPGYTYRPGWGV